MVEAFDARNLPFKFLSIFLSYLATLYHTLPTWETPQQVHFVQDVAESAASPVELLATIMGRKA